MEGRPRYARSGGVAIAYRVFEGDGPPVVFIPGFTSNVGVFEEVPTFEAWRPLLEAVRLIMMDKRGTGLSDRSVGVADLQTRMDDVRAVMDAVDVERAHLVGLSEGGPMSVLFAATYPDRVLSLTLMDSFARFSRSPSHPWMPSREERETTRAMALEYWGTGLVVAAILGLDEPDAGMLDRLAGYEMAGASPDAVGQILDMNMLIDVCDVLPSVRVPTLVVHDEHDPTIPVACARYLAEHIPDARLFETSAGGHGLLEPTRGAAVDEVIEFITGVRRVGPVDRVLSTVLFTDIVGSTERAAVEGDARWRSLLDRHDEITRACVAEHRGVAVKSTGDGFLAHFDGPGRAVRCAETIGARLHDVGLAVRAGLHTGEIELRGDDIGGLAVHVAARVSGLASAGEVLVSRTVKDLTVGSDLAYVDRGEHELKGVPDRWQLFEVVPA